MTDGSAEIERHYGRGGLLDRILAALKEAGKDIDHLTIDDLAPIDELHSRRRLATRSSPNAGARRPSACSTSARGWAGRRATAKVCGCRVTGVDRRRSSWPWPSSWRAAPACRQVEFRRDRTGLAIC
jgi:hypothetical protein